jgi:hypothetical protein
MSVHRSSAFDSAKKLRHMPIAFVSAGCLEGTVKEKPVAPTVLGQTYEYRFATPGVTQSTKSYIQALCISISASTSEPSRHRCPRPDDNPQPFPGSFCGFDLFRCLL